MRLNRQSPFLITFIACLPGCGVEQRQDLPAQEEGPFAVEVILYEPGANAGFGQDRMPEVVFGPPRGAGTGSGSTDVVSLGTGGVIVLRLGRPIVDEEGADLIVFENPFLLGGGPAVNDEPGEVSVSVDGETFVTFPCAADHEIPNGCAGATPVLADDDVFATDPTSAGGDAFDLADVSLSQASFVRIVDRGGGGTAPSAGFDLDAVVALHH